MKNKATQRADGTVEVVTVNAAGTETRTVLPVGPLVGSFLAAQLNEVFATVAADDAEANMRLVAVA